MFSAKLFLLLEAVKKGRVVDCTRDVIFNATLTSKHVLKKESGRQVASKTGNKTNAVSTSCSSFYKENST